MCSTTSCRRTSKFVLGRGFGIVAAVFFLSSAAGAMSFDGSTALVGPASRTFEFTYRVTLTDLPKNSASVRVWIPLPPTTESQTVTAERVETAGNLRVLQEGVYGNWFAVVDFDGSEFDPSVTATYRVTRRVRHSLRGDAAASSLSSTELRRYLSASRLVAINGDVADEAESVAGDAEDPADVARRLYDHIVDTVVYDKSGEGWGRGDAQFACDARAGNCTDFHSLFLGEVRSLDVPARFVMGFPLPDDRSEGLISGYHCWAEFYTRDCGWVAIDASEAFKHPEKRDFFFGNLDAHRIQFTRGRDLKLPESQGPALNYMIYPYVEIDGRPHTGVATEYRFRDIPAEDR